MSFRKRNVGLSGTQRAGTETAATGLRANVQLPGVRPSPVDSRAVTSTGTAALDGLLAGHGGLALGTSILLEESGTTDYAGALLRFYAAEGLMQGHHVHVVGLPEQWSRELPGVVGESDKTDRKGEVSEKMKIAWRYERLGQFGADNATRERVPASSSSHQLTEVDTGPATFCHTFDLSKRLVHPKSAQLSFVSLDPNPMKAPFDAAISKITSSIMASPPDAVHRVVIPSLLSPALYPPHACSPQHVLKFQYSIRAMLSSHSARLTVMQSLPLSLYPRSSGLTRWIELLSDGVFEMAPFPHSSDAEFQASRDPATKEEPPQGMLQIYKLPIYHDRGSGMLPAENDWTFSLSRRKLTIKPFNLPPIEGDTEAQQVDSSSQGEQKAKKADLEF